MWKTKRIKERKYVHKQAKMESQRNVAYSKKKTKNAIDINITQMMVGRRDEQVRQAYR